MSTAHHISQDDLVEYIKALKDYQKTGINQSLSIIQTLKSAELSQSDVGQMQPGSWLRFVEKTEPATEDEAKLKKEMKGFLEEMNRRFKVAFADSTSEMKEKSKERSQEAREDIEKENRSNNNSSQGGEGRKVLGEKDASEGERKLLQEKEDSTEHGLQEETPKELDPEVRDFTLKNIARELVSDLPKSEKRQAMQVANEKAVEIEQAIKDKTEGNEEEYRLEARNVSTFLATKSNEGMRKGILEGEIKCKEFVEKKENFLSELAKEHLEENQKRIEQDGIIDPARVIMETPLYKCENCGSRRIRHTEKQMNMGSKGSTTVLACADCEHVQLKGDVDL